MWIETNKSIKILDMEIQIIVVLFTISAIALSRHQLLYLLEVMIIWEIISLQLIFQYTKYRQGTTLH